jgi:hypothetical protein
MIKIHFMETRLVEAELFHADRRTDGQAGRQAGKLLEAIVAFRNFAEWYKSKMV